MNERFLSRGKREDNGAWETGFLVIKRWDCSDERYFITDKMTGWHTPVIPETVGQCTGLKDKNGKLIFEGDIIKTKKYGRDIGHSNVNNFDIFKVIYEPAVFRLKNVRRGFNLVGNGNDFEVIGNVMDNSELLEVEE